MPGKALNVDCHSWLDIDYLGAASFKEHGLGVVESTIIYPDFVVLVASDFEGELSVQRIPASSLSPYVISI